ncbi:protein ACCELERATED CELL DEATH 6-like [Salvia divinorum]|uniref:Protein ACCELERATED CELL DEATH 6-like n=1 Tax=Salvia divinorum TaxID=28513 RepID=A0ABD1IG55_SALDI
MSVPKYPGLLDEEESYETAQTMDPKLYRAIMKDDILEFVRAMECDRQHGPTVSCVQLGPQNKTVLHVATSYASYEIVKLICKDLPDLVAEKNARGDTALHIAARAGSSQLVTLLVNSDFAEGGLREKNEEGNTALHEALKYGHEEVARILINRNPLMPYSLNKEDNPVGSYSTSAKHKNKSPVFAAILGHNIDVIKLLWEKDPSMFQLRNSKGKSPLHAAVCMGFTEGVEFLLDRQFEFAYRKDKQGFNPIHSAASKGLVDMIQTMLQHRPDTGELLTAHGQNILHVAARSGKYKAVEYMLKRPDMEMLINEKDVDGNTPLHLATIYAHPKLVGLLVRDKRVIPRLLNNNRQMALDIAEEQIEVGLVSFHKRLTCMALRAVDAPRAHKPNSRSTSFKLGDPETESWRDKINTILLVATLVATVTFQAGFTVPGGNNNTHYDPGIATMLKKVKFQEFVICNTIAMHTSVIVAVTLLWAQLGDPSSMRLALKSALLLLGIALAMMSIAFLAGVYLVVSTLCWLAITVLLISSSFVFALIVLFFPLCFLGSSNRHIFRRLSYYPVCLVLYALRD